MRDERLLDRVELMVPLEAFDRRNLLTIVHCG